MDDLVEIFLEIVLEGVIEAAGSKKVPMPVRILLAGVTVLLALGLLGFLFWTGVREQSLPVMLAAGALLVGLVLLFWQKVRKFRRRRGSGKQA